RRGPGRLRRPHRRGAGRGERHHRCGTRRGRRLPGRALRRGQRRAGRGACRGDGRGERGEAGRARPAAGWRGLRRRGRRVPCDRQGPRPQRRARRHRGLRQPDLERGAPDMSLDLALPVLAAEHPNSFMFPGDVNEMWWNIAAFVIVAALLYKFGWAATVKAFKGRTEKIELELAAAEAAKAEAAAASE